MALSHSASIVMDSLVFYVDAANKKSYSGTGSTWSDLSTSANNATLVSSPTLTSGSHFSFNTTARRATINSPYGKTGQMTASIGYRRNESQSSSDWRTLLGHASANFHHLISQQVSRNLGIWDGSFKDFGYNPPQDSKFHIYTVVYTSGSSATLYIDGIQGNTVSTTLDLNTYKIGSIGNWSSGYWAGDISFVQLYSRALTAAEIKENFNAVQGRYGI